MISVHPLSEYILIFYYSTKLEQSHWYDEGSGKVFCLCEAPSKEAAEAVHREAHGEVADEITEVREGT